MLQILEHHGRMMTVLPLIGEFLGTFLFIISILVTGNPVVIGAVLALVKDDSTIGDYFNVGGIGEVTIKELAERIIARTGSSSKLVSIAFDQAYGAGFEDMQRRVPNISKVKAKIGWSPAHNLDSIIDSVAAYLKK